MAGGIVMLTTDFFKFGRLRKCMSPWRRLEGRLHRGDSFSEPNLTTAGAGAGRGGRQLAGFPPGFTVDELRWYRKKKPPGEWGPKDNLRPEEGSMKKFKTEYKRCFKHFKFLPTSSEDLTGSQEDLAETRKQIRPLDYLKLEGDFEYHPEYRDLYIEYPFEREARFGAPQGQLQLEEGRMDITTEKQEKYAPFLTGPRTQLVRRSSNLQRDGEFMVKSSEMHSQFTKQEGKRADITRRPTSLRMEGGMAVTSETADQFVEFLKESRERPDLAKAAPNNLKLEGEMDVLTESNEKYVPFELPKRIPLTKQPTNLHLEGPMETHTEQQDKYVPFNVQERAPLVKRHTNLQLEGEMDTKSEKQEKFIPHNVEKRPAIVKRDTNLHLEGEMSSQTEKNEKYVPFELSSRQKFQKRPTNLHLDGEMDTQTEKNSKYVPYEVQKRAPLAKKDTNLQLEGDIDLRPEYRQEFIEHHIDRTKPKRPVHNLGVHIDDNIDVGRKKDKFFEEYQKPYRPVPSIRFDGHHEMKPSYKENYIPHKMEKTLSKKPKENLKPEGAIDLTTETQTKFIEHEGKKSSEGQSEAEHKNKSVSFPRKAVRHAEEITAQDVKQKRTRSHAQAGNLKSEGQMESTAEYRSSYVDFPRERPVVKKPEGCLRTEGHVSHLSEKSSAYVPHGVVARPALARREDSLKMDDGGGGSGGGAGDGSEALGARFECQPEYRKAYNDFLQRETLTRKPRKLLEEVESSEAGSVSRIPLPKGKRQGSKSPSPKPGTASTAKSRSVSPTDRRRRRPVPRTPQQQRVLVPDMGEFTPRRPSSIFGPKTGRWYPPRAPSPGAPAPGCGSMQRHCSDDEWECGSYRRYERCSPCCEGCHRCHSRSVSRWESPCGRRDHPCDHPSPRYHSPSPPRRLWSRGRDAPSHQPHQQHQHQHQPHSILRPEEKPASFVVLTDKVEINNNRLQGPAGLADITRGGGGGGCCKEQKWMPPWYEPPM